MIDFKQKAQYDFEDLLTLVSFLRSERGCPWDHVQTHESIRRNFLEEAYEACEGIDLDDPAILKEELGDVLLQVVFHADIEKDRGRFTIQDVCDAICKKLIFRHPHLFFGGERQDWDELKKKEKGVRTKSMLLGGVAKSLPALIRAEKICEKSGETTELSALDEAFASYKSALGGPDAGQALGELLLAAIGAGVPQELDGETALHCACDRYIRRTAEKEQRSQK